MKYVYLLETKKYWLYMNILHERLQQEIPFIENALLRACNQLPHVTRPIAEHIFNAGGKRLRPFLTVLMARLLGYEKNDIYDLAISMEMLHAATLLHDDVFDGADTRRGHITAHKVFGTTATILAGDAILATANMLVADFNNVQLCRCFSEATQQTAAGEILEIQHLRSLEQDESVYENIVLGKTAWLLKASCLMGALQANATSEVLDFVGSYGQELGMAYQMVDDALDFAPQELTGKPSGGDICEGKLTPPIRLYREYLQGEERKVFDLTFTHGAFTETQAARIGAEICRLGFDAQTRQKAGKALERAQKALEQLTPHIQSETEKEILLAMTTYMQQRQK